MSRLSPTLAGVLMMLFGMFLFAANDALGKWLVGTYSVGQVLLLRSLVALVILLPFLVGFGWRRLFQVERPGLQVARVALASAEVFCFYFAVRSLPLADTMTFWMASPIYVALLSPLLLRESVGLLRWGAILLGFVGVFIALAPEGGAGLDLPSMIAIVGSLCFALMVITGRSLRGTPDVTLVFWQLIGAGALGFVAAPVGFVMPDMLDGALLGLLGVVAMGAHLSITRALKLADASLLAPLHYTLLLWAILLGWLFFGDIPQGRLLFGAAIIVLAGLILAWPNRRTLREKARAPG